MNRHEERQLAKFYRERNLGPVKIYAVIGYTLVPLFWLLDLVVVPEHADLLLKVRAFIAASCVGVHLAARYRPSWIERALTPISMWMAFMVAWSVTAMVFLHDGYASPYYAGICLVVITVGFLSVWPATTAVFFYALTYLPYALPLFLGAPVENPRLAATHHVFLLSTIIISFVAQQFRFRLETAKFLDSMRLAEASRSLEDALGRLTEMDRLKNEFFNNVTHELRTPLTMILSPLDVMLHEEEGATLPRSTRASLQLIWRNGIKLLKLINDLLDLSKIEERYLRLRVENTDLTSLLIEITEHAAPLAARKNIDVELNIVRTHDDLHVDVEKLERVFVNLLSNALKFSSEGGCVTIELDTEPGPAHREEVVIRVRDTGVGIAPDKLEVIFERFRQAHQSTTRRYGGTGIGLAFAREISRLHGGDIEVESIEGEGSTFSVRLPTGRAHLTEDIVDRRQRAVDVDTELRSGAGEPREWTRVLSARADYRFLDIEEVTERRLVERGDDALKATRVLVVEDNIELLRFIHSQLADEHAVYLAQHGRQGLELAIRERPDIIVTDYMMPELDGIELITELRKVSELSETPIVMLTAKNDAEDRIRSRSVGADAYLSKPFSPQELRATIRALLEKRGRQATNLIAAQAKSLEIISAGLAHEIHNPLSYVRNAQFVIAQSAEHVVRVASALPPGTLDEEAQARLTKAVGKIESMTSVAGGGIERIESIVDLVRRYAREGYPDAPESVVFDGLVREVIRLAIPARTEEVTLEVALDAAEVEIACIVDEMQQVIRNLIQNAIDAVAEQGGGRVEVRTRCDAEYLYLDVIDDGPGIPRELLSRIFTPFFSTKAGGEGMGLGLAICHQVVRAHRGVIDVSSSEDEGTHFVVRVPRVPVPGGRPRATTSGPMRVSA